MLSLQVFTWVFTVEMMLKIIAFGPLTYLTDWYNVFDAVIVGVSLFEFGLYMSSSASQTNLNVFRTFRLVSIIQTQEHAARKCTHKNSPQYRNIRECRGFSSIFTISLDRRGALF